MYALLWLRVEIVLAGSIHTYIHTKMGIVEFLNHSWADFAHLWYKARCGATLKTAKYEGLTPSGFGFLTVSRRIPKQSQRDPR